MSLVAFDETALSTTTEILLDYDDGGTFVFHGIGTGLGATLTVTVYSKAHQGADEKVLKIGTLSSTPTDPGVLVLQFTSGQPFRIEAVLSASTFDLEWWVEAVGEVASVEDGEGTVTATGSEQTLVDVPYEGTFLLLVDVSNMQAGDDLKLRLKTQREASFHTSHYVLLEDAQTTQIYAHGPLVAAEAARATLQQTAGSNRSYNWALLRIA